jgi:hypothetical protein
MAQGQALDFLGRVAQTVQAIPLGRKKYPFIGHRAARTQPVNVFFRAAVFDSRNPEIVM